MSSAAARRSKDAAVGCGLEVSREPLGPYRVIPEAVRSQSDWAPTWERWDSFGMPMRLGFFLWLSRLSRWVAVMPSANGAVEVPVPAGTWSAFLAESGVERHIAPDVEALLVRGTGGGSLTAYVVPLDLCYELVALVRQTWHGIDGGDAARWELEQYFERLRQRLPALAVPCVSGAR